MDIRVKFAKHRTQYRRGLLRDATRCPSFSPSITSPEQHNSEGGGVIHQWVSIELTTEKMDRK
jgi:hypothetical protein